MIVSYEASSGGAKQQAAKQQCVLPPAGSRYVTYIADTLMNPAAQVNGRDESEPTCTRLLWASFLPGMHAWAAVLANYGGWRFKPRKILPQQQAVAQEENTTNIALLDVYTSYNCRTDNNTIDACQVLILAPTSASRYDDVARSVGFCGEMSSSGGLRGKRGHKNVGQV
eukprot:scaffold545945_cov45-Prasinocladus_malaysianus.AAC.1